MRTATTTRTRERFSLIQSVARPRVEMNSSGPFRSFRVYLIFLPIRFLSRSSFDQFPRVRLHACGILLRQSRSPDNLERRLPGSEIPGRMRIGIVHQPGARFHRHSRDVAVRERMSLAGGDLEKHSVFPGQRRLLLGEEAGMGEDVDLRPYGGQVGAFRNRLHDGFPVHQDHLRPPFPRDGGQRRDQPRGDVRDFDSRVHLRPHLSPELGADGHHALHDVLHVRRVDVVGDRKMRVPGEEGAGNDLGRDQFAVAEGGVQVQIDHYGSLWRYCLTTRARAPRISSGDSCSRSWTLRKQPSFSTRFWNSRSVFSPRPKFVNDLPMTASTTRASPPFVYSETARSASRELDTSSLRNATTPKGRGTRAYHRGDVGRRYGKA